MRKFRSKWVMRASFLAVTKGTARSTTCAVVYGGRPNMTAARGSSAWPRDALTRCRGKHREALARVPLLIEFQQKMWMCCGNRIAWAYLANRNGAKRTGLLPLAAMRNRRFPRMGMMASRLIANPKHRFVRKGRECKKVYRRILCCIKLCQQMRVKFADGCTLACSFAATKDTSRRFRRVFSLNGTGYRKHDGHRVQDISTTTPCLTQRAAYQV
jgi:hypothetical protein